MNIGSVRQNIKQEVGKILAFSVGHDYVHGMPPPKQYPVKVSLRIDREMLRRIEATDLGPDRASKIRALLELGLQQEADRSAKRLASMLLKRKVS